MRSVWQQAGPLLFVAFVLLAQHHVLVLGFAPPTTIIRSSRVTSANTISSSFLSFSQQEQQLTDHDDDQKESYDDDLDETTTNMILTTPLVSVSGALLLMLATPFPAEAAATSVIPSALWAYGHYASILVIFGCLATERTLVKPSMTVEDEELVVKLDVLYGIMAALLIISGLFRATDYGKGSEFYLNEPLFWVKMIFSGIWGGLSIFPSITFYKRNFARKDGEVVPPLSEKLAARLVQIINAELTAMLSIPFVATLMARGVGYQDDLYWPAGLTLAILATIGSFYLYAQQALTFSEDA